jgi:hypothetical protein
MDLNFGFSTGQGRWENSTLYLSFPTGKRDIEVVITGLREQYGKLLAQAKAWACLTQGPICYFLLLILVQGKYNWNDLKGQFSEFKSQLL